MVVKSLQSFVPSLLPAIHEARWDDADDADCGNLSVSCIWSPNAVHQFGYQSAISGPPSHCNDTKNYSFIFAEKLSVKNLCKDL